MKGNHQKYRTYHLCLICETLKVACLCDCCFCFVLCIDIIKWHLSLPDRSEDFIQEPSENIPSDMCGKRRFISACAFAQSDRNLHSVHFGCKVPDETARKRRLI